jgi:hypothetical protein
MEESVFHIPEVFGELDKYVEVRLHTDVGENHEKLHALKLDRLAGNDASPYYEIVDPATLARIDAFEGADLPRGGSFREFLRRNAR